MPEHINNNYLTVLNTLRKQAQQRRHRRLAVLSGEQSWARELIAEYCSQYRHKSILWVSKAAPNGCQSINHAQAKKVLGTEIECLVYDVYDGFDPNAIAAVSGALVGGGLLFLIVPEWEQWGKRIDPDYKRLLIYPFELAQCSQRFICLIKDSILSASVCLIVEQNKSEKITQDCCTDLRSTIATEQSIEQLVVQASEQASGQPSEQASDQLPALAAGYWCTSDQLTVINAIINVCSGHRRRPLVITSNRGRGKSSALGIACAKLVLQGVQSIIVTAPTRAAVQAVFEHAAKLLKLEKSRSNTLVYQQSAIVFIAPDELLKQRPVADCLLVDEAAAIPAAMLEQMLRRYSRIVFSTTAYGYEGTGRGFAIRFKQSLDAITPQWKSLELTQAIRWADNDPVERWLFDALLLQPLHDHLIETDQFVASHCEVRLLDRDQLLVDRDTLHQLFSLLVNAHYQTSPNDLRNLLDGPNVSVWIMRYQGILIAAALVTLEGNFDESMAMAVYKNERRPQGHLLPQTLAAHCGLPDAPRLSYWRIMRIAVQANLQGRGVGKLLLKTIAEQAQNYSIDMLGSSFAATDDVMRFWRASGYSAVRVGISLDVCSGVPSVLMLFALSQPAQRLAQHARVCFVEQFGYGLPSVYKALSTELVCELLSGSVTKPEPLLNLHSQDWKDIDAFTNGYRQYETCMLALYKFARELLGRSDVAACITPLQKVLFVKVVLQHNDINTVAVDLQLTGRKQLITAMRLAFKQMLIVIAD